MAPWISMDITLDINLDINLDIYGYLLSSTLDIYDASAEEKAGNPSPYQAASWWWELVDLDVQWLYTLQQQVGRPWVLKGVKIRVFELINGAKCNVRY